MAISLNPHDMIIVGQIESPEGNNGWLRMVPWIEPATRILNQNYLMIKHQGSWKPFELLGAQQIEDNILVRIIDCNTADTAETFKDAEVAIKLYHTPELPIEEYQRQELVAEGHREFGAVAARRDIRNPISQTTGSELQQQAQQHPILGAAAQFSGDDNINSPLPTESEEGQKAYDLQLQERLELQQRQEMLNALSGTPRATPG